ncbi:hypothetical protein [Clostridium polynesiense]|uniref:hypothetical protein n=1 Tax=Clostridium polynesiense TaxID=1325933 RepID=UPI000590A067|nr:hypothetical protein [Clostridium polynesiense]
MKLSKREKLLLMIFGILMVGAGYYKYIFHPQRTAVNKLKEEKTLLTAKLDNMKIYISSEDKKEKDIKIINEKIISKTGNLYPSIEQQKLIVELDKLLKASRVDGNMSFSEITAETLNDKKNKDAENVNFSPLTDIVKEYNGIVNKDKKQAAVYSSAPEKEKKTAKVQSMKINLNFKAQYSNFINLLRSFETHDKKIAVSSVSLTQNTKDEITGTAVLEVFAVPKITDEDGEYLKWEGTDSQGKENPFKGGETQEKKGLSIEDSSKSEAYSYDFIMSVRGVNSDLPSFILGKAKDRDKKTYIYADNKNKEEVEIVFTAKEGRYFYKYKTAAESYPLNYEGEGTDFLPSGSDIVLKAYSSKRKGEEDVSSVNIKIINNTDKNILFNIEGDEAARPRITVNAQGGNVDVKRN